MTFKCVNTCNPVILKFAIFTEQNFRIEFFCKQFTILLFLISDCYLHTNRQINIATNKSISENIIAIRSSATAYLPVNCKMSSLDNFAPTWNDTYNLNAINFAFGNCTPITNGRYELG